MPPKGIVTDCHNLVPKRNKKKNLFLNHFRIVWNLSGSELTRRDQTVANQSIEIAFPIKWIQSNRSESSFLGWWGVLPNKNYGCVYQNFWRKALKRYQGIVLWAWFQVTFTSKRFSRIHSVLTHQPLREHKVYAEPHKELFNSLWDSCVGAYSQTNQSHQNI